jgi:hypothetical protein
MTSSSDGPATAPVIVAQETLTRYVGAYEIPGTDNATPVAVSISGNALFLDFNRGGPERLVPLSETDFSLSGTVIRFVADDSDVITHLVIRTVEGEDMAVRKQ